MRVRSALGMVDGPEFRTTNETVKGDTKSDMFEEVPPDPLSVA